MSVSTQNLEFKEGDTPVSTATIRATTAPPKPPKPKKNPPPKPPKPILQQPQVYDPQVYVKSGFSETLKSRPTKPASKPSTICSSISYSGGLNVSNFGYYIPSQIPKLTRKKIYKQTKINPSKINPSKINPSKNNPSKINPSKIKQPKIKQTRKKHNSN